MSVIVFGASQSTDSNGQGSVMWARVKGATENAVRAMPFKATYMFRPGYIQPMRGIKSSTSWYRVIYSIVGPLIRSFAPCSRATSPTPIPLATR